MLGSSSADALRDHLRELLASPHAHVTLEQAISGLPVELRGAKPPGQPHTLWRLLEHMRLAQWDIVEFSRSADHKSPAWPEGYWPAGDFPPDDGAWDGAVRALHRDLESFVALVDDPGSDLFAPFPWGKGQTLLREALLIADHNAYHIGQMVTLRQLLGSWPPAL
jgi:DinB superfamily